MDKKTILIAVVLLVVVAAMLAVWYVTRPEVTEGSKTFTVTVIHGDGTQRAFSYTTTETMLGACLEKEGLIDSQGADPGMFHTVDGERADWNTNQSYWAFYLGEEYAVTGIYDTPIAEGTDYRLVYSFG